MNTSLPNFFLALPELFLLVATCLILLLAGSPGRRMGVNGPGREANGLAYALTLATIAICALLTGATQDAVAGGPLYTFNGLFVNDRFGNLLKFSAYGSLAAVLVYSRTYLSDRGLFTGEFLALLLFALLGMMVLISANSFLTVYLGLELLSLCLYTLVALNRDSPPSTEAAMKYFILGALASGLLLYGMSMVYGATGTLDISAVAKAAARFAASTPDRTILLFGLVFLVAGIAFKLGVAPFHMWVPDVYQGAPTAVTLVLGTAPKLAAFAMAMRILVNGLLDLAIDWQQMLMLLAVLSLAVGNITAIAQTNLKRMLAYSTIAHMGFMLLGILSGVIRGNTFSAGDAYVSSLFYTLVYVFTALAAFGVLVVLSREGYECETLDDLRGLNRRSPWTAFLVLILMFSLAGVPPTAGFYAKLSVLLAVVTSGQIWLAVVAVLFSLIGAFYYLRVVKLMYFDEPGEGVPAPDPAAVGRGAGWLLSVNGLAVLFAGILPGPLMAACLDAIRKL